jgi:hypothetical protein
MTYFPKSAPTSSTSNSTLADRPRTGQHVSDDGSALASAWPAAADEKAPRIAEPALTKSSLPGRSKQREGDSSESSISSVDAAIGCGVRLLFGQGYRTRSSWDAEMATQGYYRVLADLTPELVELAFDRAIALPDEYLPTAGRVRAQVQAELEERAEETNRRVRERAMLPAPIEENDWALMTPEQQAEHDGRVRAALAHVARTTAPSYDPQRLRRRDDDPENPRPQYDPEQLNRLRPLDELRNWRLPNADDPRVLALMREVGVEP